MNRPIPTAHLSLVADAAFAAYHWIFGIQSSSWWLLTLGTYYLILSIVRLVIVKSQKKGRFIARFTGLMLMILSVPLVGTVILSIIRDRGLQLHPIVMITIAAYAFGKISLATVNIIKSRHSSEWAQITLQHVSLADAFVSIFALQRSMLVSFEGMSAKDSIIMNMVVGSAVCIIVFGLGLHLWKNKR